MSCHFAVVASQRLAAWMSQQDLMSSVTQMLGYFYGAQIMTFWD